jgi:hypothetical protein
MLTLCGALFLKKHIDLIECVQRRFTGRVCGTSGLSYEERLRFLRLPSLEYRRVRGDLIEVFKIVHNFYDPLTTKSLLKLNNKGVTRGHNFKLTKSFTNTHQFKFFFTNRIITSWNNLPAEAVDAKSLNVFKNCIDRLYKNSIYSTNLVL